MSSVALKILLVVEDGIEPAPIEDALPPGSRVTRAPLQHAARGWAALREPAAEAELLVVGCSHQHAEVLDLVDAASRQGHEGLPVVVLYYGSPNGFMEQAFAAGADDLITLPQPTQDLAFALEKAIARRRGGVQVSREGALITVLGPKGGTGKTLTACNLAVSLARHTPAPVVVDLDLQFGDVGLALGLKPELTIYDLATSGGSIDADKVETFLAKHESGVHALLAPLRPDQAAAVSTQLLRSVFETLRSRHDFIIVDTPPAFTPEVIAAIDASTHLCVVGMLDALSLKDTKIGLETLEQMGYDSAEMTLVLNRADTTVGISQADVAHLLGRRPDVLVPSDRAIPRAITEGRTIVEAAPRSGAAAAYLALAEKLAGKVAPRRDEPTEPVAKRRRTLLGIGGGR
jgi:pilus assembly protein CpaE